MTWQRKDQRLAGGEREGSNLIWLDDGVCVTGVCVCVCTCAWLKRTVWGDCGNGTGGLRYWMASPEPEAVGSLPRRADSRPATQRGIRRKKAILISNSHSSAPPPPQGPWVIIISVLHRCRQWNAYPLFDFFSPYPPYLSSIRSANDSHVCFFPTSFSNVSARSNVTF